METNQLISIIIPVYNTEKYLDKCIRSVVDQTYKNLEIILVDDGSPDNCPQLCDEWAEKDKRIRVLHIENNGVANARNKGIEVARGNFIAFVDSDDFIEKDMYEYLVAQINAKKGDIAVCGYWMDSEEQGGADSHIITAFEGLKKIVVGDYKFGVLWNKLYKKKIIENVKMPPLVCCEDLVFNYFAFKNAGKIVESDKKLYHYVNNDASATNKDFSKGAFDAVRSKEIILEDSGLSKNLAEHAVYGYILSSYVVLNGVITNRKYLDRYDELRNGILKYKMKILFSGLYSCRDKIKTVVLWLFPKVYNRYFS